MSWKIWAVNFSPHTETSITGNVGSLFTYAACLGATIAWALGVAFARGAWPRAQSRTKRTENSKWIASAALRTPSRGSCPSISHPRGQWLSRRWLGTRRSKLRHLFKEPRICGSRKERKWTLASNLGASTAGVPRKWGNEDLSSDNRPR